MDGNGNVEFKEEDGIDYAPVTVQLPGGERVPFLFTIKELNAKGSLEGFGGDFVVPSYRGSSFLDPKVTRRSGGAPAPGVGSAWAPVQLLPCRTGLLKLLAWCSACGWGVLDQRHLPPVLSLLHTPPTACL